MINYYTTCIWCGKELNPGSEYRSTNPYCGEKCQREHEAAKNAARKEEVERDRQERIVRQEIESQERIARADRELREKELEFEREKEDARRNEWERNPENWDGDKWVLHLKQHPEDAFQCNWKKLKGANVAELLCLYPGFANKFEWAERMTGCDWSKLLREQPQFAKECNWSLLTGSDFARLLQTQPQFSDKCTWSNLAGKDWALLLKAQPQFADKCDKWEAIEPNDWARLLTEQPRFESKFNAWDSVDDASTWVALLIRQPQFATKSLVWVVRFTEVTDGGNDKIYDAWKSLLENWPQFSSVFEKVLSWDVFDGNDWAVLLSKQPSKFWTKCNYYKLSKRDWNTLLEKLENGEDTRLLDAIQAKRNEIYSEINPFIDSAKELEDCDDDTWIRLLSKFPQYAVRFHGWNDLSRWEWGELLVAQPIFSAQCDELNAWNKLWEDEDGCARTWGKLLNVRPEFLDRCDVKKGLAGEYVWEQDWDHIFACPVLFAKCIEAGIYGDMISEVAECTKGTRNDRNDFDTFSENTLVEMLKISPNELPRYLDEQGGWQHITDAGWKRLIKFDKRFEDIRKERKSDESTLDEKDILAERPDICEVFQVKRNSTFSAVCKFVKHTLISIASLAFLVAVLLMIVPSYEEFGQKLPTLVRPVYEKLVVTGIQLRSIFY